MSRHLHPIYLLLLGIVLVSCQPTARPPGQIQQMPYFRPPTSASQPSTEAAAAASAKAPGQAAGVEAATAAGCRDNLTFRKDLTIPDGTVVAPQSTMDKRWEVENTGNCNWDDHYRLRLIAGPDLGAQKEQALFPARSGSRAAIRILFKAPVEPGAYRSAWQAFDAQGEPFGDPFFIDIVVQGN